MRVGFLEDRTGRFYKRIFVGGGTVNILSHLGSSGVSLWESFFFFLIYNYNIYEYKCMREGPAHQGCWLQKGRASEPPLVDIFLCLIWGNGRS